ncbi:MAG: 50S ribosomal protein L35 [Chloroflexi bacterium]|nr:50S ribosomal protein L35 [Chloroflexota bacterium]
MQGGLTVGVGPGFDGLKSSNWAFLGLLGGAPKVSVWRDTQGRCYRAEINGHFTLAVADDDHFRMRLLVLFLLLLELPDERRHSRRTRDGRTPFVRQQDLAAALGITQPEISRWESYSLKGDWRRLLSQHAKEVLTLEVQQKIIEAWARVASWGVQQVHELLVKQGLAVTLSQVQQAAHESGWQVVRSVLARLCVEDAGELKLRDDWLVGELLGQIRFLLDKLDAGERLTAEERVDIASLQSAGVEMGFSVPPTVKVLPWLLRVEQVVFGRWEAVTDESVRCIYCHSDQVARKSRKPRHKKYVDEQGQMQQVAVYRYYCRNPKCEKGSFTNLPAGLMPYCPYRLEVHLLALQMYEWGYSNYRRTGRALGVTSKTAYSWVSMWGHELLPVAALFGMVRSSGAVGIDEKYVLVPKNDKPEGKMRRWMYVYFAVDVYTYDLLHIAVYPHNNRESAEVFLLALRAKGYRPRVIVTDLRQDYGPVVAEVFPKAEHHECIFHALQNVQRLCKEVYGDNYAENHPEAEGLKRKIYDIFEAKIKRTAHKRYGEVLALRERYVQATPSAVVIFDFLERHWPKLVNGIESDLIPTTNNTVELVIRRFDQHYQNFCGFQSIESAGLYLAVFEKLYRLTPFSQDAQVSIRGKSPLQLAGYNISKLPMSALCNGQSIIWPVEVAYVPQLVTLPITPFAPSQALCYNFGRRKLPRYSSPEGEIDIMPKKYKLKTHKGAQKRLHVTGTGKIMRTKGRKSHLQRRKSPRAKRLFGEMLPTSPGDARRMKRLIPYGD